mmetsp:Transcript_3375/g.5665  ORF Transcript_3375/g.5665 Transcript_3375/m.5665 type:complete len:298 (-) Transcript_3375:1158-2051(-)
MSTSSIIFFFSLAVKIAASFITLARSAPDMPMQRLATSSKFTSGASFLLAAWTLRMLNLPLVSGRPTWICRSNLPGRSRALSRTSGMLVAPSTMTPWLPSKPSISVRSWLMVCSLSSLPIPMPWARCRPTASSSSMKMMQGAFFFACSNKSLTLEAPTPTNISINSAAEMEKKGTPASPATALASMVFPVPGGPIKRAPLGILAPIWAYLSGCLRKSTISVSSILASSTPATSSNLTPVSGSIITLALDLPMFMGFMSPPLAPPSPLAFLKRLMAMMPVRRMTGKARKLRMAKMALP